MYRFVHALALLVALALTGCGGGRSYTPVYAATSGATPRAASVTYDAPSAGAAVPEAAPAEPDPRSRPGLATQWGEARASRVQTTRFTRAHPTTPTALAMVHYNDASGAAAQTALASALYDQPHAGIGSGPNRVFVSLLDENGRSLPAHHVNGRTYVLGEPGRRYSIRVDNRTPYRFEAVVSVDGLDVVDGREASLAKRGYIVPPGGSTTIEGFRTSTSAVAAFRFGAVGTSYAALTTGSARNVGVVGVALFAEAGVAVSLYEEAAIREQANPFPGFAAPPPSHLAY